jgi:hypothetical protein
VSLNYTTYSSQLANLMVQDPTQPEYTTFLPGCIDYAEQRIYRELDLQVSRVVDNSATLTQYTRNFTLPTSVGVFTVVEQINVVTPVGATTSSGSRVPLTPVTKEFLDFAWPSQSSAYAAVPIYCAPINNTTYVVGPAPDQAYSVEVIGTQRPAPLSASNSSTFLTQYLPDLFIAASMVFATAFQRDFGAQVDDPQRAASWESQYGKLMQSANIEELRKRFMGPGWQAMTPSPVATPARQ